MFYLSDYKILDQRIKSSYKSLEDVPINGFVVTSVPDQIPIDFSDAQDNPPIFSRKDLLRQKYEGILSQNPFFTNTYYEDDPEVSQFNSNETLGATGTYHNWLRATDGILETELITLSSSSNEYMIHYDLYTLERVTTDGVTFLYYKQENPTELETSNDFSVSLEQVTEIKTETIKNMSVLDFDNADSSIKIRFENNGSSRIYLGGFAIFHK